MSSAGSWWKSPYLIGYVALYALTLFLLHHHERFELGEPLAVALIVGVGFSAASWWLTRQVAPLPFVVKRPGPETALVVVYLILVAAFLVWGLNWTHSAFPAEPLTSVTILVAKLMVFVLIPAAASYVLWGYRIRDYVNLTPAWRSHVWPATGMSLLMIAFQLIFGQGPKLVRQSGFGPATLTIAVPLAYAWLVVEVGLVEEFFFRTLLQSRLAAWLKSETGGVVVMALLFGLVHAPGFYLRPGLTMEAVGTAPSVLMAVGYSIVVTSVAGFFLGVLWARTRNLPLVMAVHAAGDLVPNLVPMLKNWV